VPAWDASDIRHYDDSRGADRARFLWGGRQTVNLRVERDGMGTGFRLGPGDPIINDAVAVARLIPFHLAAT
jgi:hypothetical protein